MSRFIRFSRNLVNIDEIAYIHVNFSNEVEVYLRNKNNPVYENEKFATEEEAFARLEQITNFSYGSLFLLAKIETSLLFLQI